MLTALLRVAALLSSLVLAFTVPPVLHMGRLELIAIYALTVGSFWLVALERRLPYRLRGAIPLVATYALACTELLSFGYSEDSIAFLTAFALFALIFFDTAAGIRALLLSAVTLLGAGVALTSGWFVPLVMPLKQLVAGPMLVTWFVFVGVVGTIQAGIAMLLSSLEQAWHTDHQLRLALEQERTQLEQRVAERTHELVVARDEAHAASVSLAAQNHYLELLRQTTLDLLSQRELDELLQCVVERATEILDAPYGELMLVEGDELVVHAYTRNQPYLQGDRVTRTQALLSWQAYDTMRPVTLDDYTVWSGRRTLYDGVALRAVADFPIIAGKHCLGVLAMGRTTPDYPFTSEQRDQGMVFAQLAAVMLENARLHTLAQQELGERRRANAALQATTEALQAQNAELHAFARTVAHDLKTPLIGIVGLAQLLQLDHRNLSAEQIDTMLDQLVTSGHKAAAIVDALLLLAATTNSTAIPRQILQMERIVQELPPRLQSLITSYGATLVVPDHWPAALGYGPWVEEVWVNYVSNAIKYGGSHPTVTLGANQAVGGMVRFWVCDNGPGLDARQQARLFTPFTRLHQHQAPGHGLGLSIVQRIVSRLGGEVGVVSAPGQGSTFFFTLPATEG